MVRQGSSPQKDRGISPCVRACFHSEASSRPAPPSPPGGQGTPLPDGDQLQSQPPHQRGRSRPSAQALGLQSFPVRRSASAPHRPCTQLACIRNRLRLHTPPDGEPGALTAEHRTNLGRPGKTRMSRRRGSVPRPRSWRPSRRCRALHVTSFRGGAPTIPWAERFALEAAPQRIVSEFEHLEALRMSH